LKVKLEAHFHVINLSEGGAKLTNVITEQIEIAMRSHPGPNQVYVIKFGSNNMRKTTKPALEIAKIVSRYRKIMTEAQRAKVRVLLCGTIPDPRPAVDSKLKLLDEALNDLEMGEGNKFLSLRGSLLDAEGRVRTDIFKPRGDIHLNASGTAIVSLRIRRMLEIMMPALNQAPVPVPVQTPAQVQTPPAPVQTPAPAKVQRTRVQAPVPDPAPVVVNTPPVVGAPLVAVVNSPAVVNALAIVNAPSGVQHLVGQVQDLIIQHVAVVSQDQVESPMEVEDEDALLQRLFFKRFGRALPKADEEEKEKEKESDVDKINFVIDLTEEDEMEVATSENVTPVAVVKIEQIEVANVNVADATKRRSFRLERLALSREQRQAITEFGKSLRKTDVILEKEAPLAAGTSVIADTDTDMAEDVSANPVGSVNAVESVNTSSKTYEQIIADIDDAIKDNSD
jgi:hypothetical protein